KVSNILTVSPRLGYLEFLATLTRMDVLLVNDSLTSEFYTVNPYLPSKVSDYLGARKPIWAVVEPGSVLSNMEFPYKTNLGDVSGVVRTLRQIIADMYG